MTRKEQSRVDLPTVEDDRTGLGLETLKRAFADNLFYILARFPAVATPNDYYLALAYTVRDRMLHRWLATAETYLRQRSRTVCYLSAEFLLGPQLGNNLINIGILDRVKEAVEAWGLSFEKLLEQEEEPGLGNGGLGRLAACYLDSLATLRIPSIGYGVRYEFGIFDQEIRDGWQVEVTDKWLRLGNPWEIPRPEITFDIGFGGHTESFYDHDGRYRVLWLPGRVAKGVAYDTPVVGYRVNNANLLRLWKAEACESFDFDAFNVGDYYGAVEQKIVSENITKILYPNDEPLQGKRLRLEQQYFFVSCSLQDMIRIHLFTEDRLQGFDSKYAVQLNDTHPSIAVPELMRLLVDVHDIDWDTAWGITVKTFAYTNHTLLPEALEKWPLDLFRDLLPRHLEIIFEINRRFLDEVRIRFPGDGEKLARLSLIEEGPRQQIRMANLACVGSHAINGVAELHTRLLTSEVLRDFYDLWPERFHNETNGVTPRRWMALSNPDLTELLTRSIGDRWLCCLEEELQRLEPLAEDPGFRADWQRVKTRNKERLADIIRRRTGVHIDPRSMFDIHVKRIHEYKRQHLNVLHVVSLYNRIRRDNNVDLLPRTVIFGGKAAPGYRMAKLIIKLITSVAGVVNNDPRVGDRLKVVFLPDFNVKNAHAVYPAADLSEQIPTAGKEASGTGNMKFALNGALTIGTLDGANVQIRDAVGAENFFLFGLTADQIRTLRQGGYAPREYLQGSAELRDALDLIASGFFSHGDPDLFRPLVDSLLGRDEYMLLADYPSYIERQDEVARTFRDSERWTRMSILNVARMGEFSSDRAIKGYCRDIWQAGPVDVEM